MIRRLLCACVAAWSLGTVYRHSVPIADVLLVIVFTACVRVAAFGGNFFTRIYLREGGAK